MGLTSMTPASPTPKAAGCPRLQPTQEKTLRVLTSARPTLQGDVNLATRNPFSQSINTRHRETPCSGSDQTREETSASHVPPVRPGHCLRLERGTLSEAGDGGRSETQPGWTLTAPSTFKLTWPVIGWAWSGLGCTWARMRGGGWSQMQSHLRPWDPALIPLGDLVLCGQIPSEMLRPPVPLACSADRHSQPLQSRVDLSLLLPAWRLPPRQVPPPRTTLPSPSLPGALRLPGHLPELLSLHVFHHLVGRGLPATALPHTQPGSPHGSCCTTCSSVPGTLGAPGVLGWWLHHCHPISHGFCLCLHISRSL